ncbi:MAG TPA: hypothetical protein VGJ97_08195 [Anaerolineaceae bacterium]|jgi:hypothetical protein
MKKSTYSRTLLVLICLGLVLAACSPSQPVAGDKAGSSPTTPAGAQPAYPAAATKPAGYPAAVQQPAAAVQPTSAAYPAPQNTPVAQAQPGSIQVVKADGSSVTLSSADLQKISPTDVSIGQSDQSGYKLSDVLAAAGVTSFTQVVVIGSGGSAPLAQADVTAEVILSTVDPTSLQLVGPSLSADKMVKGVSQIQVK